MARVEEPSDQSWEAAQTTIEVNGSPTFVVVIEFNGKRGFGLVDRQGVSFPDQVWSDSKYSRDQRVYDLVCKNAKSPDFKKFIEENQEEVIYRGIVRAPRNAQPHGSDVRFYGEKLRTGPFGADEAKKFTARVNKIFGLTITPLAH